VAAGGGVWPRAAETARAVVTTKHPTRPEERGYIGHSDVGSAGETVTGRRPPRNARGMKGFHPKPGNLTRIRHEKSNGEDRRPAATENNGIPPWAGLRQDRLKAGFRLNTSRQYETELDEFPPPLRGGSGTTCLAGPGRAFFGD